MDTPRQVVDPEENMRVSDYMDTITDIASLVSSPLASPQYEFESHYRGDNHTGYNGSVRVFGKVEFDWNGRCISNFKVGGDTGDTHRDWSIHSWIETPLGDVNLYRDRGSENDRAPMG